MNLLTTTDFSGTSYVPEPICNPYIISTRRLLIAFPRGQLTRKLCRTAIEPGSASRSCDVDGPSQMASEYIGLTPLFLILSESGIDWCRLLFECADVYVFP